MELADYARRNAREAAARKLNERGLKTIKKAQAEQEALRQRRLELQRASTVAESMTALRRLELLRLGAWARSWRISRARQEQNERAGQNQVESRHIAI